MVSQQRLTVTPVTKPAPCLASLTPAQDFKGASPRKAEVALLMATQLWLTGFLGRDERAQQDSLIRA